MNVKTGIKISTWLLVAIGLLPSLPHYSQNFDSLQLAYKSLPESKKNNAGDTTASHLLYKMILIYPLDSQMGEFSAPLKKMAEKNMKLLPANHPLQKVYKKYLAYAFNDLGIYYREQAQTLKAIECMYQGLGLFQELGQTQELGEIYNNIATVYYDVGDEDKALEYYMNSYNLFKNTTEISNLEQVLANVAYLNFTKTSYDTALKYYNIGLTIAEKHEDKKFIAEYFNGKALVYAHTSKYSEAQALFQKSLNIRREIQDVKGIAVTLNNLGDCYFRQKEFKKALEFSSQSLEMSRSLNSFERMRQAAFTLKNIYEGIGNYQQALKMYELYIQIRDSTNNLNTKKEALKKQLQYDYEKKEILLKDEQLRLTKLYEQKQRYYVVLSIGSVLLLIIVFFSVYFRNKFKKEKESKNLQIVMKERLSQEIMEKESIANSFIRIQEEEREKLAAELHDGVNQLLFAAKMQLQAAKSTSEPMHRDAVKLVETAIQEIRSIAGNQGSFLLTNKSLNDALTDLSLQMEGNKEMEITFVNHGLDEDQLEPAKKVNILRIIQELLNNALKHSATKKSCISIKTSSNSVKFSVTDFGSGFANKNNATGNGLKNIGNKVLLMKGRMRIFTVQQRGTKIYVEIPIV
ncbi:MAG: tetratricopeptide repeat protein [Bacteroidia bacterium]|nr:tetratricopeptide repeat protein [Bacteroidia bacterium]